MSALCFRVAALVPRLERCQSRVSVTVTLAVVASCKYANALTTTSTGDVQDFAANLVGKIVGRTENSEHLPQTDLESTIFGKCFRQKRSLFPWELQSSLPPRRPSEFARRLRSGSQGAADSAEDRKASQMNEEAPDSPAHSTDSRNQGAADSSNHPPMKYVVVTGGTVSGLGKGTAISSIGVVLRSHGLRVTAIKIDPYLNIDAGTMSPFEHGEVYVLDDGGEVDLDLGNYERFLGLSLTSSHSLTSGKVYEKVLKQERTGAYLGKTVQMVPHVTDAIQEWLADVATMPVDQSGKRPEVCLIELGGTVGDIESAVYLEALQQFQFKVGTENFLMAHVGFVPVLGSGEQKTKPCQHSVKVLREAGIKPDLLLCRSEVPLSDGIRNKLRLFCQVLPPNVISLHDILNLAS
eukprot:gnl/TRDRNA2_/TRDRNA2_87966_c1_seq1.p1 gnl/TRDRNA2_/TRDRNA2_87966_c1~~gnl/TRDRNA2_/TRDRNA2_87966_c1_seq1.p1  ORF type:complete len:408 (-),score=54.09 gnl/TRDRNA2_/TRDRNA2_87966_c1_seq1:7-1230(-)